MSYPFDIVETQPDYQSILKIIATCNDPQKLTNFIENASRKKVAVVRDAAIRRLAGLVPDYPQGSLEYDFWQSLNAYEIVLQMDRRTKVRLNKTRDKVEQFGIEKTLSDWAVRRLHERAFNRLVTEGMADLTGEGVILRHSKKFDAKTRAAARKRLTDSGVNV